MASDDSDEKNSSQPKKVTDLGKATVRRLQLSKRYYSGELESDRQTMTRLGSLPWRILRYEHIIEPEQAILPLPALSYVTPKTFRKHLKYLTSDHTVVPLEELVTKVKNSEKVAEKTIALTFDCGWMDFFLNAYPVIREFQVPVTLFLPTAFIGTNDLFWEDKVLLALLHLKQAKMKIEPFEYFTEEFKKTFWELSPDGEISIPLISLMIEGIRDTTHELRQMTLGFLGEMFNAVGGQMPMNPFFLTWEEVKTLEREGVRCASQSHGHFSYRGISEDILADDLRISWNFLSEELERPLKYLAFPHGYFEGSSLQALEALGFEAGFVEDLFDDQPAFHTQLPIFRRISMNELETSSIETFFTKIWDLPISV